MIATIGLGLALVIPLPAASPRDCPGPPIEKLRRLVEQRNQESAAAEVAIASARAHLAKAEGKTDMAAAEGRKVVRYYEDQLAAVRKEIAKGRVCFREPLDEAEGAVAIAGAWLADIENRRDDLLVELPKVIAYHEGRIRRYDALLAAKAIDEAEAKAALEEIRAELRRAKDRLAAVRGLAAGSPKLGHNGKP
jgi:hypothetical protein